MFIIVPPLDNEPILYIKPWRITALELFMTFFGVFPISLPPVTLTGCRDWGVVSILEFEKPGKLEA
jgi:hypothetical protein